MFYCCNSELQNNDLQFVDRQSARKHYDERKRTCVNRVGLTLLKNFFLFVCLITVIAVSSRIGTKHIIQCVVILPGHRVWYFWNTISKIEYGTVSEYIL